MNGTLELLTVAFMASPVVLVALIAVVGACVALARRGENSSRPAQRQHDREYAPVRDVYVVFQTEVTNNYTTYEEHTHQDNRQIHIHGDDEQRATLGTGSTEIEQGQYRSLPRQRKARCLPR